MTDKPVRRLLIDALKEGMPGISPSVGTYMAEACLLCCEDCAHDSGVELKLAGMYDDVATLHWDGVVTDQIRRSWRNANVATEQAAYGVAFLVLRELTGYVVIEQSFVGPGFDYWIGEAYQEGEEFSLQKRARLEVSGIRRGDSTTIRQRVKEKLEQTHPSDQDIPRYPAFVVVVEFSRPEARVAQK